MAGYFDTPDDWRLTSFDGGSVKIKYIGIEGSFEEESAGVTLHLAIPAEDLVTFLIEAFPPPAKFGNITVPQNLTLPNVPGMVLRRVSFKSFVDGKPVDPFGFDSDAPSGTYHPMLGVDVEYTPRQGQQSAVNKSDPRTFLEISANTTGDFLSTKAPGAKWQPETRNASDPSDLLATSEPPVDPDIEPDPESPATEDGDPEDVTDPTTEILIPVPSTEWSVKWNQIPYAYWDNVMLPRIRWCLGKINHATFPLFSNAYPETILFVGWSIQYAYSWRDGNVGLPPVNLEMKFIEKRIQWNGVICGHNHFWRPGKGWERLLVDGTNPTFQLRNLSILFNIG